MQDRSTAVRSRPSCGLINSPDNGREIVFAEYGASEIFSLRSLSWSEGPEAPFFHSAGTAQLDDSFVIVGGWDGTNYTDTLYAFDEVGYGWVQLPQRLRTAREMPGVIALSADIGINC